MRFRLDQDLPGSVEEVESALTDPRFLAELAALPKLGEPEVLESTREGERVRQRVRYRFAGKLSPVVTKVLDPARLVWVDETTYDLRAHTATFRILPEHYANRLRCSGTYRFTTQGDGTRRTAEGDLVVSYPLVGRAVERAIVSGLEEHMGDEADLLRGWLVRHRTDPG